MTIEEAVAHVRRHLPQFRKAVAKVERCKEVHAQCRKTMGVWFQRQKKYYEVNNYMDLPEAVRKEWEGMNECSGNMKRKEWEAVDGMRSVAAKMNEPLRDIPGSGVSRWYGITDTWHLTHSDNDDKIVFNFDEFEFYLASLPIRQRIASWQERKRNCQRKPIGECQVGEFLIKESTQGITGFIKVERITSKGQQWVGTNLYDGSEYRQNRKGKTPVTVITEEFAKEGIKISNEYKELRKQHGLTDAA